MQGLRARLIDLQRHGGPTSEVVSLLSAIREKENELARTELERQNERRALARPSVEAAAKEADSVSASGPKPDSRLSPAARALAEARQNLAAQLRELPRQTPENPRAAADALSNWRADNANLALQADKAGGDRTSAEAARRVAQGQAPRALPIAPGGASAAEKALFTGSAESNRELQQTLFETRDSSPEEKRAALNRWREGRDSALGKSVAAAADERKARESSPRKRYEGSMPPDSDIFPSSEVNH